MKKRNKITKKVKRRGGGNTPSAMSESGIEMTEMKCHNEKRKIRSQIQEVKAALEPQFKMAEKVNVDQIGKKYNEQDLKDHETYKGMELDPGMSNRLKELYEKLQKLLDNDYTGEKVLIFSEFATTTKYLNDYLKWKGVKVQVDSATGNSIQCARLFDPLNNPSNDPRPKKSEEISLRNFPN